MAGSYVHCGINETKVWRKGPYETPILCNACGLHFKAKGTLENYLPKIAQQNMSLDLDIEKASQSDPKLSNQTLERSTPMGTLTLMEEFQQKLRDLWESEKEVNESSSDNILLFDNMNNFIPSNEIGLGCSLLKTDVTSTGCTLQKTNVTFTDQHDSHA